MEYCAEPAKVAVALARVAQREVQARATAENQARGLLAALCDLIHADSGVAHTAVLALIVAEDTHDLAQVSGALQNPGPWWVKIAQYYGGEVIRLHYGFSRPDVPAFQQVVKLVAPGLKPKKLSKEERADQEEVADDLDDQEGEP